MDENFPLERPRSSIFSSERNLGEYTRTNSTPLHSQLSMKQLKRKSKHNRQRALTDVEFSKQTRLYKPKSLTNISESSEFNFGNKFEPELCFYSRIQEDDHVWQPPSLAEQTTSISIQSMPAHLNRITEFHDAHPTSSRPDSSSNVKRSHSENVNSTKSRHFLDLDQQILETQRSKSLTHIECVEDTVCDNIQQDLARFNVSSSSAEVGLVGQRHLAVSMGDISKIDQNRGKLQKSTKTSSQETFRVSFDYNDEHVQEYLPATQGVTLRDALRDLLDQRGIDVNSVQLYQDYSNTSFLPFCDTSRLAGCQLRLKIKPTLPGSWDKENGIHEKPFLSLSKKGSKNKRGGSGQGSNAEDSQGMVHGHSDSTSRRRTKGFFPTFKSEKLDTLTELLAKYDQMGLPDLNCIATFKSNEVDEFNYALEDHWNEIVFNGEELPDKVQQQQMALWELLQTETNYINQLQVITNRFKLCLCNLQAESVLNEIEVDSVFSNIDEIATVNRLFWAENLKPMLDEARNTHKPLNPIKMKDGFSRFANLFHPYIKYCLDRAPCLQYIKDKKRVNELFKAYIAWCETQKECNRQRFTDLSFKPMQRLTKYSLLLKAVLKHTDDEEAKLGLNCMVNCVETFVTNVNSTLRQRHEQERLANIINKVESYDVVEAKDEEIQRVLKNHISLDLTCAMPGCKDDQTRQLLLEGDLKLKDSAKNIDVHCFLFTDMLLITKSLTKKGDRVKIIRQPYVVDRLVVYEMKERTLLLVYLNEFQVATTVFALSGGGDIRHWHECIKKAQELYLDAKISIKRTPTLGYLTTDDVDVDLDFPTHALLTARSPRSSQSSLIHSHSGSMDMSEPSSGCVSHGRAVSLEFADMRASSASSDEGSAADQLANSVQPPVAEKSSRLVSWITSLKRARSLEMRIPQPSSPRPERRKQLFKSNSGSNSPNTLSVSYPYSESYDCAELSPTSLLVPSPKTLSPTNRSVTHPPISPRLLKRGQPITSPKPPLVKTKNISGEQSSPAPEVASFDFDVPVITTATTNSSPESEEDEAKSKLNQKRVSRTDKRFHTADSIEYMKREKDSNIHKRFSLNYPPNSSSDKLVKNKPIEKYTSSESMYSSSGVSSIGSLHQSTDCEFLSETMEEEVDWYETFAPVQVPTNGQPINGQPTNGQPMQVDVSEIKDGISSVQIKIQDGNKPVARDYSKIKEFILNDKLLEASEV